MASVTERINAIKQPRGGYLKLSDFETIVLTNNNIISEEENIHASIIGLAVDYLTRFIMGFQSFQIKTNKHTLQLLMYWIMGQHSGQDIFKNITKLGLFNPRLNTVYLLDISKISKDIIKTVEDEIICYK